MSNPARLFLAICAAVLLAAPACAQEWVAVQSPHFSVVTDGGAKQGREIALRFEQMRSVFGQIFRRTNIHLPVPLQIVAFRNGKEIRPYAPLFQGKPVELGGLFERGDDRSYILLDLSAEDKWETVFHEYAHQLLNGNFPRMAPWFDEGFAQYFASMKIDGNSFQIGEAPEGAMDVMQRSRLMPVTALFAVTHQSEAYNRGDPRHLFYSESWLMVHYLFDKAKLKQTDDYFHLVNDEHVPVEQAIARAFGEEPKQLDKELADYLAGGHGKFLNGQIAGKLDAGAFTATPLDPLEVRITLADVHLHSPDHRGEAVKEFEQILVEKPSSSAAHRGLGYAYFSQGDFDKAGEQFLQAARLSTTDPRVYYLSALTMTQRSLITGKSLGDQLPMMKTYLQKAIELDPGFADAYSLLGFANMAEGDYQAAVANCQKAVELSPRREVYELNLGRAYLMAGKPVEAKAILEKLKDSSDQSISFPAQQELARAERAAYESGAVQRHKRPETYDAPQWHRSQEEIEREPEQPVEATPDTRPVKYLRGRLVSVDCSQAPGAALRVQAGAKTLTLLTRDTRKLLLIGSNEFSCDWKNRQVLINYKPGGKADGDLVSLELQ